MIIPLFYASNLFYINTLLNYICKHFYNYLITSDLLQLYLFV